MEKVTTPGNLYNADNADEAATAPLSGDMALYWLSALVESADDAIISKTTNGIITSWNKGAERVFGYTADEVIGKPILILIPPDLHGEESIILGNIRAGRRVEHYETIRRRKDGTLINVSLTVSPIRDGEGKIIGASKIARDVTHLKLAEMRLRSSEERYRTLFELVPVAVYSCDRKGVIQEFNGQAVELWGRRPDKGNPDERFCGSAKIFHPDGRPMPLDRCPMARVLHGETLDEKDREIVIERPDGTRRSVVVNPQLLRDEFGSISGAINCLYDITERKEAEAVREKLLGREKELRQQAEEASRLKDEFLATVSHELRTPLTSILGWIVMARENDYDARVIRQAFEVVERNARNQNQIISDILDVSRIITGKLSLNLKPVRLSQIVEAAADTVRPAMRAKNITFETELEPDREDFTGDPDRLQQICWNLLANAVKFTHPGGSIKISLRYAGDHAEVTVSDSGEGIEAEFLPFVFDRFRQADSTRHRKHGGLGLGLSIVRHLVELHGGRVTAESGGPGKGSAFTIFLPFHMTVARANGGRPASRRRRPDAAPVPDLPQGTLGGMRILVVDDERDSLELAHFILVQHGAEVFTADSADAALEVFSAEDVDVLISDIGMPEKDGYDLLREITAIAGREGRTLRSIALSAYAREEDRRQALRAGFEIFLPKPFEPVELIRIVAELDARSQA